MRWWCILTLCLALSARAVTLVPVWTDGVKPIWYWLHAASEGDAQAAKKVGDYYVAGHYAVTIRGDKAVPWYRQAAEGGEAQAALSLGRLYWYGEYGVPKRRNLALYWFYRGALLGNKEAQQTWVTAVEQSESAWHVAHPDHPRLSPLSLIHAKALVPEAEANFQQGLLCQYVPSLRCKSQALHWYRRAQILGYRPAKIPVERLRYIRFVGLPVV